MGYLQQLGFPELLELQFQSFSHHTFHLHFTVLPLQVLPLLSKQHRKCLLPKLHLLHI